jgi:lysophospholipase L1-like esterase|tara:strand:- start:2871 stop:3488 length:618 start_codon:yes stop_codon:yes gene_type:complete
MTRLIAFGCSHTQGQGLSDTIDPNNTSIRSNTGCPSKFAWPQLIANELNLECINLGVPSGSNKLITGLVSDFEFKAGDICAILWTHYDRWAIFRKDKDSIPVLPTGVTEHSKNYYRYMYHEYDHYLMNTMMFRYINLHLEKLGIKTYNFSVQYNYTPTEVQEFMLETPSIKSLRPLYACADGSHLNDQGQQILANTMLKYFKDEL